MPRELIRCHAAAGVSGSELTRRAVTQAQRLGAELVVPLEVTGVSIDAGYKHLTLGDGREIVTRTLLAATGLLDGRRVATHWGYCERLAARAT